MTDWLSQLCTHVGVHAQYRGFDGQTIEISRETQSAVLGVLGVHVGSDRAARDHLKHLQSKDAARPLPPEVIVEAGKPRRVKCTTPFEWVLEADGSGEQLAAGRAKKTVSFPALPLGIHRLHLTSASGEFVSWVLARPARAVQLEDIIPQGRIWGVLAAVYGLTDGPRAPIGSYDLLGGYAAAMAAQGADFLGINPVHAVGQVRPDNVVSPYSPSHRAFLNTWHCAAEGRGDATELVDYSSALTSNARALRQQFDDFQASAENTADRQSYLAFAAQGGAPLDDYALFEALASRLGADWRDWPAPYRNRDAKTLAAFVEENTNDIAFGKWAQWQAEVQLSRANAKARASGMRLGLYLDLAVGPRLGGAETWARSTSLVTGATLGAPPDPLAPAGQQWGLAPMSPLKCRTEGYSGFARLLRANMRHAGMIRIDHVIGLMRSFWMPEGHDEGAYVSYPFEALLAVVAIESARNNTIVVGEDLGLVPEGLRKALAASGIYGLDVLQYMRNATGGFVAPRKTRKLAVCTFATHDTPTVAGFFAAEDARVRHELCEIDMDMLTQTRQDRLRAEETLKTSDPVVEIHQRLARSNSAMVAVQLDDIAQRLSQQNLPGTIDSYPNWRLKAPMTIDEITTSAAFARLSDDMAANGRSNQLGTEKDNDLSDCSDIAH